MLRWRILRYNVRFYVTLKRNILYRRDHRTLILTSVTYPNQSYGCPVNVEPGKVPLGDDDGLKLGLIHQPLDVGLERILVGVGLGHPGPKERGFPRLRLKIKLACLMSFHTSFGRVLGCVNCQIVVGQVILVLSPNGF